MYIHTIADDLRLCTLYRSQLLPSSCNYLVYYILVGVFSAIGFFVLTRIVNTRRKYRCRICRSGSSIANYCSRRLQYCSPYLVPISLLYMLNNCFCVRSVKEVAAVPRTAVSFDRRNRKLSYLYKCYLASGTNTK